MSEPTLILAYDNLRVEIADAMGWTRTEAKWTASQVAVIDKMMQSGYRRFLFPPVIPGDTTPHKWSFLEPVTTLVAFGDASGTVSGQPVYASPSSTVTITTSEFYPGMIGQSLVFDTSGNSYEIISYTSATVVVVSGDASGETSDDTFTITADGDCSLPDDFGSISSDLFCSDSSTMSRKRVERRGVSDILRMRAESDDLTGEPDYFALAPKTHTGAAGQRQKLMFYPIPDTDYTLSYKYQILRNKIDSTYAYPAGTEAHSETILAAMLAECSKYIRDDNGEEARFKELLFSSIRQDQMLDAPSSLGYNGNNSGYLPRRHSGDNPTITYNGSPI